MDTNGYKTHRLHDQLATFDDINTQTSEEFKKLWHYHMYNSRAWNKILKFHNFLVRVVHVLSQE